MRVAIGMPVMIARTPLALPFISALLAVFGTEAGATVVGTTLSCPEAEGFDVVECLAASPLPESMDPAAITTPFHGSGPARVVPVEGLPYSLIAPASLIPSGSLGWAGIDGVPTVVGLDFQPWTSAGRQAWSREFADARSMDLEPNLELLTGIAAPEPPALVLAGFALLAVGLVGHQNHRRRQRTAT